MAESSLFDGADNISDEDLLSSDFDEVINILGTSCGVEEEILIIFDEVTEGTFNCQMCTKICKSKSGLTRHTNNKHRNDAPLKLVSFSNEDVAAKLAESITKVLNAGLYAPETTLDATTIVMTENQIDFLTKAVNKLNMKSAEKFKTDFFSKVVASAASYITSEQPSTGVLVLSKLSTKLLGLQKQKEKKELESAAASRIISKREIAGLQYLGGYILRELHGRMKKSNISKTEKIQNAMAILKSMQNDEKPQNQKLVAALDRNGLWYITKDFENILVLAENIFCYEVKTRQTLKTIPQDHIVSKILRISEVETYFNQILNDCDVEMSLSDAKDVLQGILKLFTRVRSFNFAKDVVQKAKLKEIQDRNTKKSLRKNLQDESVVFDKLV